MGFNDRNTRRGFQREYSFWWGGNKRKQMTEKDGGEPGGRLVSAFGILDHMGSQGRVYETHKRSLK